MAEGWRGGSDANEKASKQAIMDGHGVVETWRDVTGGQN